MNILKALEITGIGKAVHINDTAGKVGLLEDISN